MFRWISIPAVFTLASLSMVFAQETSHSGNAQQFVPATLPKPDELPAPGPELLKYTPEQIEAAYEGKEMPEAVAMYLVIAKGGQLGGSGSWFAPAERRFHRALLAERNGMDADQSLPTDPAPAVAP